MGKIIRVPMLAKAQRYCEPGLQVTMWGLSSESLGRLLMLDTVIRNQETYTETAMGRLYKLEVKQKIRSRSSH